MLKKTSKTLLCAILMVVIAIFVITDAMAQIIPPPNECTISVPGKNKNSAPTVVNITSTAQNVFENPCPVSGYGTCFRSEWSLDKAVSVIYLGLPTLFISNFDIIGIGLPDSPQGFVPPRNQCSDSAEVYQYDCNTSELEINFQTVGDRFNIFFVPRSDGIPGTVPGNIVAKVDGKIGVCGPGGIAVPTVAQECEAPPPELPTINTVTSIHNVCEGDVCCTVEINEGLPPDIPPTIRVVDPSAECPVTAAEIVNNPQYGGKDKKGGTPRIWVLRVSSPGQWCYSLPSGEEACITF